MPGCELDAIRVRHFDVGDDEIRSLLVHQVARGNSAVVCLRVMTAAPAANELADFLRQLISRYRDLHKGKPPDRVYTSADIFASLQRQNIAVKTAKAGYSFDGVPIEPKSGQSLPFVLKP